jgi:hypothetical protein
MVNFMITGDFSFAMKALQSVWQRFFLLMLLVYLEFRLPATKFCKTVISVLLYGAFPISFLRNVLKFSPLPLSFCRFSLLFLKAPPFRLSAYLQVGLYFCSH